MVLEKNDKEFKPQEIKLPTLEDLKEEEESAKERKEETTKPEKSEIQTLAPPTPTPQKPLPELPSFPKLPPVPVFIRLERYNDVIKSIGEVKNAISTLANSISLLEDVESVRRETLRTLKSVASLVDEKISDLESLFLRPAVKPKIRERLGEVKGLETLIKDLKSQIESLKNQLGSS